MKPLSTHIGLITLFALLSAFGREVIAQETIARTCGGQFMEVVIQKQQRAQKAKETPTYLDVGKPMIIENWVEGETIPPGLDGRISTFQPPRQIIVAGYIYQVSEAMGDASMSTGEQTTKYTAITNQPAIDTSPDGYHWTGEMRVAIRSELVTWRRDWLYVRLKPANAEQGADDQLPARVELEAK